MRKLCANLAVLVTFGVMCHAVETQTWEHATQAEFEKGTLKHLSLRSDGRLMLAPQTQELLDSSVAYLWALAEDDAGNLYVGGGGPGAGKAKLFRIDSSGQSEELAEFDGLEIQALAVQGGNVYAATSPDGKIYRVSATGETEVYYDPKTKYIWALAVNRTGDLFVGTGDLGEVHRVRPGGEGSVFFKTEETHVRSLGMDSKGNLYAGTEPSGLIMRISPAGEGFVLYQSAKREITTIAVSPDGLVYAAGVGNKSTRTVTPPVTTVRPATPAPAATTGSPAPPSQTQTTQRPVTPRPPVLPGARPSVSGGSEVYRIDAEGFPKTLWSSSKDIVYSIVVDDKGRAVFGTGNEGRIYRLDSDLVHTLLLNVAPTQVTRLGRGRDGKLYAVTGNVGKVYRIGPELEKKGSYESDVLDARYFSYWGRINCQSETDEGAVTIETRSGNLDRPQQNWSAWSTVESDRDGGRVSAPPARFLQYRLTLTSASAAPEVGRVDVAYLHKNVAPVVKLIAATPANYRFPPIVRTVTPSRNLTLPSLTGAKRNSSAKPAATSVTQSMMPAKGFVGARWLSEDDNGDKMVYKLEIRGEEETEWKLLEEELTRPQHSWDSTAFSDGEYRVRVTASDSPANPPHQALTAQLVGEPFVIDNTPPEIDNLTASRQGSAASVTWSAKDALNVIAKAEYSLDGGEWKVVQPKTRLSDARLLDYELTLDEISSGEHTIAVRVSDKFDNQAVAKVLVR